MSPWCGTSAVKYTEHLVMAATAPNSITCPFKALSALKQMGSVVLVILMQVRFVN